MIKKLKTSLLLQIAAVFLLTSILLSLSIIGIQRSLILDYLKDQALEQHTIVGKGISENLKNRLRAAETLAASLANISLALPKKSETFKEIIPSIIDYESAKSYVAGGGVWFDPNAFKKGVELQSFFWGRNKDGVLEYFDDYNDPKGNGYHHEEWYVPARYMIDDQCYWSKSYVDPYSFQPMVTCTIAIRDKEKFIGVSTIDLKLEGLSDILSQSMKSIGGYAFAIDRNNKFLAFPDESKIQKGNDGATEVEKREYIDTSTMVKRFPDFANLVKALDSITSNSSAPKVSEINLSQSELAKILDKDSYQIDDIEAPRIARFLIWQGIENFDANITVQHIKLEKDIFLDQPAYATIFFLNKTDWKLVLVTPANQILGAVNKISWLAAMVSLAVMFVILLGFFKVLQKLLIFPLQEIIKRLINSSSGDGSFALLDESKNNEIGQLAKWYNLRTQQLIDAKNDAISANKAKSEFLANMSHELRTPLNSILGLSNILQDETIADDQREIVSVILKSSNNLLSIVNDILDISKIEEGRFNLEIIPFNIYDILSGVLDTLAPLASQKGLCINLFIKDKNCPLIMGDPLRVERILINLVGNAVKYTIKGKIDLNVNIEYQSEDMVILRCSVSDTGIGIDSDRLSFVFDKFTQADETITRRFGGTGLGLYITKSLIQLMNGEIEVSSQVGQGSCFSFYVPFKVAQNIDSLAIIEPVKDDLSITPIENRRFIDKIRVLVAEDHELNIIFIKKLFKRLNITDYDIANNGMEALNMFKTNAYDLILMDCHMPEMSGYESTIEIRKVENDRKIVDRVPIIAMTADAMVGTREKCLEAGMDEYISKPINRELFDKVLSQWFIIPENKL